MSLSIDGTGRVQINDYSISSASTWSSSKIDSKLNNSGGPITASAFIKTGGLSNEYLMADGSITVSSGSGGNSSNIYLYDSNTTLLPPTGNGQIRYNNAVQDDATEIYISHLTRDNVDIDEFLDLINDLSIIYIQDQNSSLNFIKYTVTSAPTIIVNDYITIPVLKQSSGGTGSTNFPNGHNIFMSVFSNLATVDNRITTLETKTQNQTAIANETTLIGNLITDNINNVFLKSDTGSVIISTDTVNPSGTGVVSIGTSSLMSSTGSYCIAIGAGTLQNNTTGVSNIGLGAFCQQLNTTGEDNVGLGTETSYANTIASGNTAIGRRSLYSNTESNNTALGYKSSDTITTLTNTTSIGYNSQPTTSNQVMLGDSNVTEVKSSGVFNSNIGFKTPTGLSTDLLYADGSYNSNIYNKLYSDKIGIGQGSGGITQGDFTTAVGSQCGTTNQGRGSTALGFLSGTNDQKERATAIGQQSGYNNQGEGAISIGFLCAYENQGNYAISIGTNIGTNQVANSVVISGGESGLGNSAYQTVEGFFINPVRQENARTTNVLTYDITSKEMTYNGLIDLTDIKNATDSNTPSTIVKRDASGNFSAGAITATSINTNGNSKQILLANGTVNSTLLDVVNWRYQSFGYSGTVPTGVNIDSASGWMVNQGGSIALQTVVPTNTRTTKYRVQSNSSSVVNGAISGWMGTSASPSIFIKQGFKVVIGFGLGDTTSNALTRSMIGLYQANTAPVLNNTTTVASVTTQSIGIVQENSENVWSFNTRGSASSTKVASVIPCTTPSSTWFVLEILNQVNSNDVTMILTDQETGTFATQTFTCNTTSTINTTSQCYIQCQRNMSSGGGITGSAILQTASFRMWSST